MIVLRGKMKIGKKRGDKSIDNQQLPKANKSIDNQQLPKAKLRNSLAISVKD
jgi:hypothetical protein